MAEDSDWRLSGHQDYLHGLTLVRRRYRPTATNDHDHCELCFAKFRDAALPDVLRQGYSTPDGYRWICDTCFSDLREHFGWNLRSEEDEGDLSGA